MRYGIVDIGSNTIRYKLYDYIDGEIKYVVSNKKTVGLIAYRKNGKLHKKGINALINTLKKFKKEMAGLNVDETYYFATASIRNVDNTEEILKKVKDKLDIDIRLLEDEEEATLTFEAIKEKDLSVDEGIIIDVGGGSSEISIFENKTIIESVSLPVGSLSMYEEYVSLMFPDEKEKHLIRKRVHKEIKNSGIGKYEKDMIIGIGGSIRSIKRLLVSLNLLENHHKSIPIDLLDEILDNQLCHNTKEDYNKLLKVKAERIHTFIPGLIITKTIAEYFNVKELYFTHYSIKEGVLYSIINSES